MGFSKQEYWSGLPFPTPGQSSWPRDQTQVSSIAGRFFTIWATWEAIDTLLLTKVHHLYLDSLSVLYSFMGFAKWLMSFIHYCSNIQNSFTAPEIPCTPAIHPLYLFIFYMKKAFCFSFFWLHRVLVVARGLFCCSMWDLLPLTRDRTHIPCIGRQMLNHWTTREIPSPSSFLVLRLSQFWPVGAISSWLLFLLIQPTFFLPLFF